MAAARKAAARKPTFGFDLSKPTKKGVLLKQGQYHKAFKYRFFVLYPGFLVYYEDERKWKCDVTRGETLGYRIGAVKLKNGSVKIARDAPKGCKFGLTILAPDPLNKRPSYLLNATSKPDRDAWIEAIRRSIPLSGSPQPPRTEAKQHTPKETPKQDPVPQHPKFTTRQDTADVAALAAAGVAPAEEEKLEETSIDEVVLPPSMVVRHNTADAAALLGTSSPPVIERVTSIDDELGPTLASVDSSRETTPVSNGVGEAEGGSVSPPPTPTELETIKETVESSVNAKGKTEVVTSVTVVANGIEDREEVVEKEETEPETPEEEAERRSSEVTFTREEPSNSFSVVVVDVDSGKDSTTTSSDSENGTSANPESRDQTEVGSPSSTPPATTVDEPQSRQQEAAAAQAPVVNGNGASLTPPESPVEGRKSFIEKRGFLYKRGGHHKSWNLRYFVLQPGGFTYYKKDPRTKPLGEVKLKNMNIFFPGLGEKQQSYQFHVHTESAWNKRPNWVLAAQSEREMKAWIQAFKLAGMRSGTSPLNSDSETEANGAIPTRS